MERTVYFHPQFVEELTLLPPELRIRFYADLLAQSSPTGQGQNFERYFPSDPERRVNLLTTRFLILGIEPRFYLSCNTAQIPNSMIYLHLMDKDDTESMILATSCRQLEVHESEAILINFTDFLQTAPAHERSAAYAINADHAQRSMYLYLLNEALEETRAEVAGLLNISNPQMDRMMMRIDFYLETLNRKLQAKDSGTLTLSVSFRGNTVSEGERLKDLWKR